VLSRATRRDGAGRSPRPAPRARRGAKLSATVAVAVLALSGAAATAAEAPPAKKPKGKPKEVSVADFYFGPEKLTLKEGQSVNWVWAESNTYPHDVHLKSGPKSLKQKKTYSTKTTAVTNAEFEKTFTTPGTYKFICTIHPTQMHMTIVVKK
jgi:plastocyanin